MTKAITKYKGDEPKYILKPSDQLFSREAEEAMVGAVFINQEVLNEVGAFLEPGDFYVHRHKWIWETFIDLKNRNVPIDLLTIADELDRRGRLAEIGGPAYLTSLVNQTPSSLNAEHYARIVEEYARRREWLRALNKMAASVLDMNVQVGDISVKVHSIAEQQKQITSTSILSAEEAALNLMQLLVEGQPLGIATGLSLLDKQIGAMPLGETILLVGDSTVGKTALSLQIAESVSFRKGRVLYISTESKAHVLVARRVCGITGIPQKYLRSGNISPAQMDQLQHEVRQYMDRHAGNLFFDDLSNNVEAIERSIAQIKPSFIVIDHLGELQTRGDNRTLGLLEAFDRLKHTAKKYNAAQLVIHTISADDAQAKDERKPPNFNSLGWAKDLKYKGDIIFGLYPAKEKTGIPNLENRYLWVMKDREGARYSQVVLRFNTLRQWFDDSPNLAPPPEIL